MSALAITLIKLADNTGLKELESAESIARERNDQKLIAMCLVSRGDVLEIDKDLTGAVQKRVEAAKVLRKLQLFNLESLQLRSAGEDLDQLGKTKDSFEMYSRALSAADESNDWFSRFWTRWELAVWYQTAGEFDTAVEYLEQAKKLADLAGQKKNVVAAALAICEPSSIIGRWQDALDNAELALRVSRETQNSIGEFQAIEQLVYIYGDRRSELKNLGKAEDAYLQARRLATQNDKLDLVGLDTEMTEVYWQLGRFDDAISAAMPYLQKAIKNKDRLAEAGMRITLSELYRMKGQLQQSQTELENAGTLLQNQEIALGVSCSSDTMRLADDVISFHAATFASRIRKVPHCGLSGLVQLSYFGDDDAYVRSFIVEPGMELHVTDERGWRVRVGGLAVNQLRELIKKAGESETGGLLVGLCRPSHKTVYVTGVLTPSDDSRGTPWKFTRGVRGYPDEIREIEYLTGGLIGYMGEWHTHPLGGFGMSDTDRQALMQIHTGLTGTGIPAHILIVSPGGFKSYVRGTR